MNQIPFREPRFNFLEVIGATGADDIWLRTLLARDKGTQLGKRRKGQGRGGFLMFSLRDIVAVNVLWSLKKLRVPPAASWDVVQALGPIISATKDAEGDVPVHIGFDEDGDALIWTIEDGVVVTWCDKADNHQHAALQANHRPHIVFPLSAIFAPVSKALEIAKDWENE
jgi:hypothetical protein